MKEVHLLRKVEWIIFHPSSFFEYAKKEKTIFPVLKFFTLFTFLSITINVIFNLPKLVEDNVQLDLLAYLFFILFIIGMVAVLVATFVALSIIEYAIYHVIVRIFQGKKDFKQTYKLIYAAAPVFIVALIPYVGVFKFLVIILGSLAFLDSLYLMYVGLQKLHGMHKENALTTIIVIVILGVVAFWYATTAGYLVL